MHGGKRERAGRPKGAGNILARALRERIKAKELIDFLQNVALGKFEDATVNERANAAVALLKKVLPDSNKLEAEIEGLHFEPAIVSRGKFDE